jgi:protein-S-isoprenylcysteine O-methyltransferase Ste14
MSFAWGIARFFRRSEARSYAMSANGLFGTVFGLLQFAAIVGVSPVGVLSLVEYSGLHATLAASGYAFSLGLFWWTVAHSRHRRQALAFSGMLPGNLYTDGPYRRVRHPFYLAYMLFWASGIIAAPAAAQVVAAIVMSGFYIRAAIGEETRILTSDLFEEYRSYRAKTGMFLPIWSLRRQN